MELITLSVARPFIEEWHYSNKVPTGKNIFIGWYSGGVLYAVADYGIGVNAYQASFLSRVTGLNVLNNNMLELKRLCRIEPRNDLLPLTAFISRCHKLLKKDGYRHIVSFSDPMHGHDGGIYKASNFIHLGKTNAENHAIDKDGVIRHRRFYYRHAKRHNLSMAEARLALGLKLVKTEKKDRWFISI